MVYIFICTILFVFSHSAFALGGQDDGFSVDGIQSIENDPIFQYLFEKEIKVKPSLEYLEKSTIAKNALLDGDYYLALETYTLLFDTYGDLPDVVLGLGETYFKLGDQNNALTFFNQVIDTADDNKTKGLTDLEIIAHYRRAHIYFQLDTKDKYLEELSYIVALSENSDEAIVPLMKEQTLDYIINLFRFEVDFSYIARREIGVYYLSKISKNRINESETQDIYDQENEMTDFAIESLIIALSMATHSITKYLNTELIGYEFSDLYYMIELLNSTKIGKDYINTFKLVRIIHYIWKYYSLKTDSHSRYMRAYCEQLLEQMRFFDYKVIEDEDIYSAVLY